MAQQNPASKSSGTERLVQWRDRFDRFRDSNHGANLTVGEFCRGEGVSVSNFYHWKKKLAIPSNRRRKRTADSVSGGRFIPVVAQSGPVGARLLLPGGAVIELSSELGARQLTELIAAVVQATDHIKSSHVSRHATEDA